MRLYLSLVLLLFFLFNKSVAQHHEEFWLKLNTTVKLNETVTVGFDVQHRRQENTISGKNNPFSLPMLNSFRAWVFYHLNHDYQLIISPLSYFQVSSYQQETGGIQRAYEVRTMIGTSKDWATGLLHIHSRLLYELASVNTNEGDFTRHRYRGLAGLGIQLKEFKSAKSLQYLLTNELIFKTWQGNTNFDQDRLFNGLKWSSGHYDANIGYQLTFQNAAGSMEQKSQLVVILNVKV